MRSLFRKLADLLYPPRCFLCSELLTGEEETVCEACRRQVFSEEETHRFKYEFVEKGVAPFTYKGKVRESVYALKFGKQTWIARPASNFMLEAAEAADITADVITWIPMRGAEKRKRGFDQSELLAGELGKRVGMKACRTLEKTKKTQRQSSLSARERRANVLGAYICPDPERVRGKSVVLVDDVVTTGSTVSEAARVLRTAGAGTVYVIALAKSDLS